MKHKSLYLVISLLISCAQATHPEGQFVSQPPSALVGLKEMGITLHAYALVSTDSTDPDKRHALETDPATGNFTGEVKVTMNKTFDLTVIYTADDPVSGQEIEIARYVRRNLIATGSTMKVKYEGEESSWEEDLEGLDLDGDSFMNLLEVGYASDPTDPSSLPVGPKPFLKRPSAVGTFGLSVPPPGSDPKDAISGDQEITIHAGTPFDLEEEGMKLLSPTYGVEVLSTDLAEKTMKIMVHTKRFVIGSGQIDFRVQVKDKYNSKYGLTLETTTSFAAFNGVDDLAPLELQLGLAEGQKLSQQTTFTWEMDDPSGFEPGSLSATIIGVGGLVNETLSITDDDPSPTRFRASVTINAASYPNGTYTITFTAKDFAGNLYTVTRTIEIVRCGNGAVEGPEECDDGNTIDNDACSSFCRVEPATIAIETPAGEGETVRDVVSVRANAVLRGTRELNYFGVVNRPEIVDQDGRPQNFTGIWDVRNMPEDAEDSLLFQAKDTDGRTTVLARKITVDNVPNITSFLANGGSEIFIRTGGSVTLSWNVTNGGSVTIDNGVGTFDPVGSYTFPPPEGTTIYTLTAERLNTLGTGQTRFTATKSVTVRVNRPPRFDGHTTQELGHAPDGTTLLWDRSDPDAGDTITSSAALFAGRDCAGNPVQTAETTGSSVTLSGLEPRTDYSYNVTLNDGNGGSDESGCFNLTTTDTGLVGWWRFDGDVTESSGNGLNGSDDSPDDSPFLFESGGEIDGSAISLAGNDYVRVSHDSLLDNPQTIEMRIRTDTTTGPRGLVDKYDGNVGGPGYMVELGRDSNIVHWLVGPSGGAQFVPVIAEDVWTHLVVVTGDGSHRMYLDGRLVGYAEESTELLANAAMDLFFGANINGGSPDEYFDGSLDEIALYDRVLTVDEIRRNCRRLDTNSSCPDSREPIILMPTPDQVLPPTRAYWSWRGERGRDGSPLFPGSGYDVRFDVDMNDDGDFDDGDDLPNMSLASDPMTDDDGAWYYVEGRNPSVIASDRNYRLRISPVALPALESSLLFSTDSSIIAWWRFDEGEGIIASDSVGSWPATLIDAPDWTPGFLTNAVQLDGVSSYVSVDASGSPGNDFDRTDAVSVTAWVYPNITLGGEQAVISKGSSIGGGASGAYAMSLFANPNDLTGYFYINAPTYCYATNASTGAGNWHFVGGGYNSDTGQLSCLTDGNSGTNNLPAGTSILSNGADTFLMGAESAGGTLRRYLDGTLDEVIFYNRGLSVMDFCNNYLAFCMDNSVGISCNTSCMGD